MNKISSYLLKSFCATLAGVLIMLCVHPVWVARMSAITYFYGLLTAITAYWGFNPKSEFLYAKSKIDRIASEKIKQIVRWAFRILVISAAIFSFWTSVLIFSDIIPLIKNGKNYLYSIDGDVLDNSYTLGTYPLSQGLLIRKYGDQYGEWYNLYFSSTRIDRGESHKYLITPKSKLILEIKTLNLRANQ